MDGINLLLGGINPLWGGIIPNVWYHSQWVGSFPYGVGSIPMGGIIPSLWDHSIMGWDQSQWLGSIPMAGIIPHGTPVGQERLLCSQQLVQTQPGKDFLNSVELRQDILDPRKDLCARISLGRLIFHLWPFSLRV